MIYIITEMIKKHYYGKAYVQYAAWSETYRGLMSDEFLDNRKLESCYESTLRHPRDTCVVLVGETVAGFIWYSPDVREYTRKTGMSEINALYVLKKYQGHGMGRALVEESLSMMSHKEAVLYVFRGNNPVIGSYEHMGFMLTGNTSMQDTESGNIVGLEMMRTSRLTGP